MLCWLRSRVYASVGYLSVSLCQHGPHSSKPAATAGLLLWTRLVGDRFVKCACVCFCYACRRIVIAWMTWCNSSSSSHVACHTISKCLTPCIDIMRLKTIMCLREIAAAYDVRSFQMGVTVLRIRRLRLLLTLHRSTKSQKKMTTVHRWQFVAIRSHQSTAIVGVNDGKSRMLRPKQTAICLKMQHLSICRPVAPSWNHCGWRCEKVNMPKLWRNVSQMTGLSVQGQKSNRVKVMTLSVRAKNVARSFRMQISWRNTDGRIRRVYFTAVNVRPILWKRLLSSGTRCWCTGSIARLLAVTMAVITARTDCRMLRSTCRSIRRRTHSRALCVDVRLRRTLVCGVIFSAACLHGRSSATSAARRSITFRACSHISESIPASVPTGVLTATRRLPTIATTSGIVASTTTRSHTSACCAESASGTATHSNRISARMGFSQNPCPSKVQWLRQLARVVLTFPPGFSRSRSKVLPLPRHTQLTRWLMLHSDQSRHRPCSCEKPIVVHCELVVCRSVNRAQK